MFGVHADALCQSENRQGAGCRGRGLILRPLQQLRQLGDVGRDSPRLVAANRVMIDRLAHRLDEVGELTGEQIDAILLEG